MSAAFSAPIVKLHHGKNGWTLVNDRSVLVTRLFVGKPVALAQVLLTSLLGLCPMAHRCAFDSALTGESRESAAKLTAVEAILETIRVLGCDWAATTPYATRFEVILKSLGTMRGEMMSVLADPQPQVLGELVEKAQRLAKDFVSASHELRTHLIEQAQTFKSWRVTSEMLTPQEMASDAVRDALMKALLQDYRFAAEPTYHGARMLGALARLPAKPEGYTLADWVNARFEELQRWSTDAETLSATFMPRVSHWSDEWSLATVETARGTLFYALKLEGETIADLHVIAPTEWLFQPKGLLVQWLNRMPELQEDVEAVHGLARFCDACTEVKLEKGM